MILVKKGKKAGPAAGKLLVEALRRAMGEYLPPQQHR